MSGSSGNSFRCCATACETATRRKPSRVSAEDAALLEQLTLTTWHHGTWDLYRRSSLHLWLAQLQGGLNIRCRPPALPARRVIRQVGIAGIVDDPTCWNPFTTNCKAYANLTRQVRTLTHKRCLVFDSDHAHALGMPVALARKWGQIARSQTRQPARGPKRMPRWPIIPTF